MSKNRWSTFEDFHRYPFFWDGPKRVEMEYIPKHLLSAESKVGTEKWTFTTAPFWLKPLAQAISIQTRVLFISHREVSFVSLCAV